MSETINNNITPIQKARELQEPLFGLETFIPKDYIYKPDERLIVHQCIKYIRGKEQLVETPVCSALFVTALTSDGGQHSEFGFRVQFLGNDDKVHTIHYLQRVLAQIYSVVVKPIRDIGIPFLPTRKHTAKACFLNYLQESLSLQTTRLIHKADPCSISIHPESIVGIDNSWRTTL